MKKFMEWMGNLDVSEVALFILFIIVLTSVELSFNVSAWYHSTIFGLLTTFITVVIPSVIMWLWMKARE